MGSKPDGVYRAAMTTPAGRGSGLALVNCSSELRKLGRNTLVTAHRLTWTRKMAQPVREPLTNREVLSSCATWPGADLWLL